jgi:hypothetical protein
MADPTSMPKARYKRRCRICLRLAEWKGGRRYRAENVDFFICQVCDAMHLAPLRARQMREYADYLQRLLMSGITASKLPVTGIELLSRRFAKGPDPPSID